MLALVGCGFVGSIFATEYGKLAYAGELPSPVRCFDGDTWERRNAANQDVTVQVADRGEAKAITVARGLSDYYLDATGTQVRITADNIDALLGDAYVIIDAVDNLATRQLLYYFGMRTKCPVLHLGISGMGTGTVEWSTPTFDNFALAPQRLIGKPPVQDPESGVTPPCELARMRAVGWNTSYCAAVALALFQGFDTWSHLAGQRSHGWLTSWRAHNEGFLPIRDQWVHIDG